MEFYRSQLFKFPHELISIKLHIKMKIVYFRQNKSSDISKFIYCTMINFLLLFIFKKIEYVNDYFLSFYRSQDAVQKRIE